MLQAATQQPDTEIDSDVDDCYYHINVAGFEQDGFERDEASFRFAVWQRICWEGSCPRKAGKGPKPVLPTTTRTASLFTAIRNHCSKQALYIMPQMSVREVVFRLLLKNGNKPMKLSELQQKIGEQWSSVLAQKSVSMDSLQQMLDGENEYHISRTEPPAE